MKWHHLRMDEREYERLDAFRRTLEGRVREFPSRYPAWMRGKRLSTGDTISWLIDRAHKENVRKRRPPASRPCEEGPRDVQSTLPAEEE